MYCQMPFDWDTCWDKKGSVEHKDSREISGFEKLPSLDTEFAAKKLMQLLNIQATDNVLEIGCGAGLLARHMNSSCNYIGIDRSPTMIKKNIELNGMSV